MGSRKTFTASPRHQAHAGRHTQHGRTGVSYPEQKGKACCAHGSEILPHVEFHCAWTLRWGERECPKGPLQGGGDIIGPEDANDIRSLIFELTVSASAGGERWPPEMDPAQQG